MNLEWGRDSSRGGTGMTLGVHAPQGAHTCFSQVNFSRVGLPSCPRAYLGSRPLSTEGVNKTFHPTTHSDVSCLYSQEEAVLFII